MDNAWLKWCLKCPPPVCIQADKRRRHWRIASVTSQWCHHWAQHCQVSNKKYLITHLHALSIAMERAKNYEIGCKIIWNIRSKRVAPFSGQCNLRFLSTEVLQGSVETCVNNGGILIDFFTANLLQSMMVKEFWKSVSISRSYRQKNKVAPFFPDTVYNILRLTISNPSTHVWHDNTIQHFFSLDRLHKLVFCQKFT